MSTDRPITHPTASVTGAIAAVGMFDGVHRGHVHLISELKSKGESLGLRPLAVTFTGHPLQVIAPHRAPALLSTPDEKRALLENLGIDVAMLTFDSSLRDTSAGDFLGMLHERHGVTHMLLGFNNRFGHNAPHDFESYRTLGRERGITIEPATEFMPEGTPVSSSLIRQSIIDNDIATANRLLGRPYTLTGTVGHGKEIGRSIGFPTANLTVGYPQKLIPPEGVYACIATLPGGEAPAVVNIGHRPTVEHSGKAQLSIEAHIIGFEGNLYNRPLTLCFLSRLRDEQRFPSLAALQQAIAADAAQAAEIARQQSAAKDS